MVGKNNVALDEESNFMDIDPKLFGRRLEEVCYGQGATEAKLSRATGITKSTICYYMGGKRVPTLKNVYALAKYLGVSIDYLTGNDEMVLKQVEDIENLLAYDRDDKSRRIIEILKEIKLYYKGKKD